MNRDETRDLLTLRLQLTGDNFNAGMLDTWADQLANADRGEAVVAMRRACAEHAHVHWFQFNAELRAHKHAKTNRADREPFDCALCDGTGWRDAGRNQAGHSTVEPCDRHVRSTPCTPQAGMALAATALDETMRARGHASADIDTVVARWFR